MKLRDSLQTKLTASFVLLILGVTLLTFQITFRKTKSALKEVTQTELMAVASVIASQLNGKDAEVIRDLEAGQEGTPDFVRLQKKLLSIRAAHPDIRYVYTMGRDGDKIRFLVDPDFGNEDDPGAAIHEIYEGGTGNLEEGFKGLVVDDDFTTDKWGTFLSGYAPFKDTAGHVVGIVGVDMAKTLVAEKQAFIGNTIYLVMLGGVLIAGVFILVFSKTIIKDVRQPNLVATQISMGDMDVHVEVERKDEIGELGESFGRMVASLKVMMMTADN